MRRRLGERSRAGGVRGVRPRAGAVRAARRDARREEPQEGGRVPVRRVFVPRQGVEPRRRSAHDERLGSDLPRPEAGAAPVSLHTSPVTVAVGSLVVLAGLAAGLWWREHRDRPGPLDRPLIVYAAPTSRLPLEAVAADYERETGQRVELRFGPSEDILTKVRFPAAGDPGDVFVPADDSYVRQARDLGLAAESIPLARVRAVVLLAKGNPKNLAGWGDLLRDGVTVAVPNPGAAVGKLAREHLTNTRKWAALEPRVVDTGTVTEAANATKVGSADAAIVWDAVAGAPAYDGQTVLTLPELDAVTGRVEVAVLTQTRDPAAALKFARYASAADRGLVHFRASEFRVEPRADPWADEPELVLYAGAMLRPAIDDTVTAFERREGVRVARVYSGCGDLVAAMRARRPDAFFACDARFMTDAEPWFGKPASVEVVSNNLLVIGVPKGNPRGIRTLKDLGKPGLRVGVGHEQRCALGGITKETLEFVGGGTYAAVRRNVKEEAPDGGTLVTQLRSRTLDAAITYTSFVTPHDDIEGVPVTGIDCAAPNQPFAVGPETRYPQLAGRLFDAIKSAESRARFERLGFGWGAKK
ncbi:MAG: molybdate ABC transporter substrate-binding protein [Isosphaera sp.]|nr:molybdate ABC transporter substrate-binding protein [Isosphaera sp.]